SLSSCGEKVQQEIKVKSSNDKTETSPQADTTSTHVGSINSEDADSNNTSAGEQEETSPGTVSTRAAGKYIGENKTVRGDVADVNKRQKVWYLNFDGKYPNNTFTGVIFPRSFDAFPDVEQYEGKTIEISGEISEYNGKPQIILNDPSQVKVID
ncbi:MAG TPA: hypothetical protein VK004_04360, partial [Ignavibacteria bacterium]|nr:hypothetical protein [Ignavibacteria bacterium]